MPHRRNYYEILGLDPDADMRAVKRAWREAARTLHPDLPANRGSAHAKRRFQDVKDAYDVLSDPQRRQEYDDRGSSPFLARGSSFVERSESDRSTRDQDADDITLETGAGEGVASIFADLFGGVGRPPPKQESPWDPGRLHRDGMASRPADQAPPPRGGDNPWDPTRMEAEANADRKRRWGFDPEALAEAALKGDVDAADSMGASPPPRPRRVRTAPRSAPRSTPGPTARPSPTPAEGDDPWSAPAAASRATPRAAPGQRRGDDLPVSAQVPFAVAALGGRHKLSYRIVGEGSRFEVEEVELFLPSGTEDGAELVLRGKGPPGDGGGARGDLRVTVYVEEHAVFRRRDRDVVMDLPLTPYEAATGLRLEVPTLQGRQKLTVPPGVRSGQKLRLRGLGVPSGGGQPAGNQELVIQIHLPEALGSAGLELLKQLDGLSDWNPRGRWPEP